MIKIASKYVGVREGSPEHKRLIDEYNSLVSSVYGTYRMSYTDPWCAAFVSLCGVKAGYKNFPCSAACDDMLNKCHSCGFTVTNKPQINSIIFFDWNGDGSLDHVGIVENVSGNTVYTIEGNTSDSCARRSYSVHNSSIKYYAIPPENPSVDDEDNENFVNHGGEELVIPEIKFGSVGEWAAAIQALLIANGYSCGGCGIDGEIGKDSETAIKEFQKDYGLNVTGIVDAKTRYRMAGDFNA